MSAQNFSWQQSLFATGSQGVDRSFSGIRRHKLDATAWVDHCPGWLSGADEVFAWLLDEAPWKAIDVEMYGRILPQPRLVARWPYDPVSRVALPPVLEDIRAALADRYRRRFDSVAANLYRNGRDSVAWHGDRIPKEIHNPLVATISLGHARRFLLRPRGGTTQLKLELGPGDLCVMGGSSQRTWQHSVPKVAHAGPRISITVRHSS